MEHFFNRKPTKGYIELAKEREKNLNNRHITDENITVPFHISKAACYVEDARDGRLANGKGKMSEKSRKIQLCFFIQTHDWWSRFIYLSIMFLALLIFFEPPSSAAITVCERELFNFDKQKDICNNTDIIKDWEAWTLFVEFLLIMIFVTDIFMKATYMKPSVYFTKKWHKVQAFFILLFSIDWIIFVCTYYALGSKGLRFSRPFRPVLLLTRYRELRRILETLTDMTANLVKLTAVIIIFVALFAWIGVTLFGKTYRFTSDCVDFSLQNIQDEVKADKLFCTKNYCWDRTKYPFCLCGSTRKDTSLDFDTGTSSNVPTGCDLPTDRSRRDGYLPDSFQTYNNSFHNPLIGIVRLIVLLSTENYPDIMLPAYKTNLIFFAYFFLFIFIGMFLLLSVLLAVIVEFWLSYLKKTNDSEKRKERLGITKAFIWIDKERNYYIKEQSWNELILLLKKDFTKLQSHFMFQMLDWEQKGQLDVLDFLNITEALKLHYTLKDADTAIENTEIGQFARRVLSYYFTVSCGKLISPFRVNVKKISILFSMLHTVLAAVHAVIIPEVYIVVHVTINTILLLVLLSEVLLRVMAHGSGFFHPLINKWEVASITGSFFCMIGYWITWLSSLKANENSLKNVHQSTKPTVDEYFRVVWGLLIFFRLALQYKEIRGQLVFFYKVFSVLMELFLFIVIIVYVFLGIGLELFAIASSGEDNNYFQEYDCELGFISTKCGFITLWQVITTSNWHEIMNPVQEASGWWAYVYFILFYIVIDLILLDLMIAIAIEMYNAVRNQDQEESFGDQPGIEFEVYEGTLPDTTVAPPPPTKPERRRSRLGSIFNTNGTSQPEPYRTLILCVTRSKKGSWRQSIITSEMFSINNNEIEAIQKSLEKDYPGPKDKSHSHDERGIEVRLLYNEKTIERNKLSKPDCKLYIKSFFKDPNDNIKGKLLIELNDNQSSMQFRLVFKSDSKPVRGIIRNSDEVKCDDYYEIDENEFSYHPTTKDYHAYKHWKMKRIQKQNLMQDQVSFLILTQDKPHGAMSADIEGIKQEKKLWENRKESIHSNAETFGKISPLLRWFAHRVSTKIIKDDDEKDSSDEGEEGDVEAPTIGRKQEFRRKVYVPNEYKADTKYINEAHKEWLHIYQKDIPEVMGDTPAAVLDQVKNFMVNQSATSGRHLAPPGSSGVGNRCIDSETSSEEDDDDDDEDEDDNMPGLSIGGGANKLKGLFEAIANAPERKLSSQSRKSSTGSYKSQKSNRSSRSQPTPSSNKSPLIIPQVINTDHDEETKKNNVPAELPHELLKPSSSAPPTTATNPHPTPSSPHESPPPTEQAAPPSAESPPNAKIEGKTEPEVITQV